METFSMDVKANNDDSGYGMEIMSKRAVSPRMVNIMWTTRSELTSFPVQQFYFTSQHETQIA